MALLLLLASHLPLLTTSSSPAAEFEEDFVHSFLSKPGKLRTSPRLEGLGQGWVEESQYQNVVGIVVENWTNQRLEFPSRYISQGATDTWYKPQQVPRHTRELGLLAYGVRGSPSQGSLCYLVEDSWPILHICLGWETRSGGVYVLLSIPSSPLDYSALQTKELNGLLMKDKMRFYKGTEQYVVAVTAREAEGSRTYLTLSVIPQRLDVWAWEKYYKQAESVQSIEVEVLPTEGPTEGPTPERRTAAREELENDPGIFERKELLTPGEGVLRWQGNLSEREVLAGVGGSVSIGVRVENWSQHTLSEPSFLADYGQESTKLPMVEVAPGALELVVLKQGRSGTGVSGVVRWRVGATDTVLSLMVSAPYSRHLYSSWVAAGLTKADIAPDFSAMYSGTPDSAWFVRAEMGRRLEFTDGETILVVTSDPGTSRPVVRLAVVPRDPKQVALSISQRLEGRGHGRGREGDRSHMALHSSGVRASTQCHCPCMGAGVSPALCLALRLLILVLVLVH